jgi:carboxyl-terminal processing protease
MPAKNQWSGWLLWAVAFVGLAIGVALNPLGITAAKESSTYPQLRTFTEVLSLIEANYVNEVEGKKLIRGAINGMLRTLDPHTSYLSPESYREMHVETSGRFGGLGIEITIKDGILTVVTPIEDTPAYRKGIKAGDQIFQIEEKNTKDMTLVDVVRMLRGKPGSDVTITVRRKGVEKLFKVTITREIIRIKSVRSRMLKDEIGYVRLRSFQSTTGDEVRRAIEKMQKKKVRGLVLDLRNNPGGLLSQAVAVSDLFLGAGNLIVYTKGRMDNQQSRYTSTDGAGSFEFPVAVLVNPASASASEIVAGAFQDLKRATIIGEKTFGKGSVQTIVPLTDGSGLRLTTALYYTPKGRRIQGKGIEPDIAVSPVAKGTSANRRFIRERDLPGHIPSEDERKKGAKKGIEGEDGSRTPIPTVPKKDEKDVQLERAIKHLKDNLRAGKTGNKGA